MHEQRVVGPRADDADLDAILRVPAGEAVEAIEPVARVEVVDRALAVDGERLGVARDVDRPPPDVAFRNPGCLTTRLSLGERPVLAPE